MSQVACICNLALPAGSARADIRGTLLIAAVHFTSTVTLGAVITATIVIVAAGLPVRLIQTLRNERQELERLNKEQAEELGRLRVATDLTALGEQQRELHVATLEAIREIAQASMHESDERLNRLESAVAGGMAAHTKELHKVATILDKVATKLEVSTNGKTS